MAGSATNSAIEVAYWFINKAEQENLRLEDEKLQHLLFLSQIHFALKNNIDASVLSEGTYNPIGGDAGYKGTFDGRDYRIIGLSVGSDNATGTLSSAGIFGTIASEGVVKNLRVYGSEFYGLDYAGTIAGINKGTISKITTIGNHIEAFGSGNSITINGIFTGLAGGIAGYNTDNGVIKNISASDSVVAGDSVQDAIKSAAPLPLFTSASNLKNVA